MKKGTERFLLFLAGAAGIGSFFLPFFDLSAFSEGTQAGGYIYVQEALNSFGVAGFEGANAMGSMLSSIQNDLQGGKDYLEIAGLAFILIGPIVYLLLSLGYLIRSISGKSYKRGTGYNFIYPLVSFGILYWLSSSGDLLAPSGSVNFFTSAGLGFWVAFAAVFVAGFSLALSDDV